MRKVILPVANSLDNFLLEKTARWIELNTHPLSLGSGIPLFFDLKRQNELERLKCRTFINGWFSSGTGRVNRISR